MSQPRLSCRGVCIKRLPKQTGAWHKHLYNRGFTLIELLIVISIIIILAGLTIATMGYVQSKARRSRAEAEIAAISAACENYKADTGIYPRTTGETDKLDPASATLANYAAASLKLYEFLSGDTTD